MTPGDHIVAVDHVDKTFSTRHILQRDEDTGRRRFYVRKTVHAARDISFGIRPGEIFGLLGPNGAGKTTTIKMLCGLVKPSAGAVYIDGLNVEQHRLKALRRVGVVLEGARTSIWPLTPLENLHYYGNLKDVKGKTLRARAREMLIFIGLKEKMNVPVRHLSRGEKQKLAICIALIADPPIILLDEPTTGLDVQSARSIKDKIIEMTRAHGKSALVTTHDMHVAQELCDRIGIIDRGRLVACHPTHELLSIFSEATYEFHTLAAPALDGLTDLPGVVGVAIEERHDGPVLVVHLDPEPERRSEGLYALTQALQAQGAVLRGIEQKKQNLESVFLRITDESAEKRRRQE